MPRQRKLLATAALAATLAAAGAAFALDGAPQIGGWGFDLSGMDREAKPGDSFFDFASGAWDSRSVIPRDKSFFGAFDTLRDRSQEEVRAIIEDAKGRPIWKNNDELKSQAGAQNSRIVTIKMTSSILPNGDYLIKLEGKGAHGDFEGVEDYQFQVVRR